MSKHIKENVSTNCEVCQKTNPKLHNQAVLHPIAVKAEVWHQVGIDLVHVGPLTLTKRGNRYVGLNGI